MIGRRPRSLCRVRRKGKHTKGPQAAVGNFNARFPWQSFSQPNVNRVIPQTAQHAVWETVCHHCDPARSTLHFLSRSLALKSSLTCFFPKAAGSPKVACSVVTGLDTRICSARDVTNGEPRPPKPSADSLAFSLRAMRSWRSVGFQACQGWLWRPNRAKRLMPKPKQLRPVAAAPNDSKHIFWPAPCDAGPPCSRLRCMTPAPWCLRSSPKS